MLLRDNIVVLCVPWVQMHWWGALAGIVVAISFAFQISPSHESRREIQPKSQHNIFMTLLREALVQRIKAFGIHSQL
jgi:hypothetical protein